MNRRRFWQISLRSLLLLTTLAAIWLGYVTHKVREQRAAVALIKQLGGRVSDDYQEATGSANTPGWPWLRRIIGDEYFQDVTKVMLEKTPVSDTDLQVICKLTRTKGIILWQGNISDAALASLERLPDLSVLDLRDTKVTSEGFGLFKAPPSIETVVLSGTMVKGDGARAIGGWTSLTLLGLDGTDVSAEDIDHLSELKNLQILWIRGTNLDDSAEKACWHFTTCSPSARSTDHSSTFPISRRLPVVPRRLVPGGRLSSRD
jgi:hypothetical protein